MASKIKSDQHLEIAHVLFIDVAGYSKLLVNEQRAVIEQLNQIVRKAPQVRKSDAAGKLIRLPAGDGPPLKLLKVPWQLSHAQRPPRGPAPALGEHTESVLGRA